ncbi:hypothetical protein NE237_028867 [Protea cynaroides]|uniref:PLD phosphodiesterase domain-containing protein n=1 Tax=Protea cynaroides TaxID=273540 RepID=A0A9Q0GR63_9MAGN|nr:hypothetical protein NE237_028867 [Protea cynaroides]
MASQLVFLLFLFNLCFAPFPLTSASQPIDECKAWLVQSIPTNMTDLTPVPGVLSTADVFRWLAGNTTRELDITAQYWEFIALPNDNRSGDYGYTDAQLGSFGANEGLQVYQSLQSAADRNVSIRILQNSGFYPDYDTESASLAAGRPNVQNVTLLLSNWYGSGIVHAKVWISDSKDIYIGSANNDWKSLTQVKELGIYLVNCSSVATKVEVYFNNLWKLAFLNSSLYTKTVWDQQWQIKRQVPCWSHFVPFQERCRSPLPHYVETPHVAGYPTLLDPNMFQLAINTPGYNNTSSQNNSCYLSFAPPEMLFTKYQADEQGWVDTIKSVGAGATVRINTMDWLGQSQYLSPTVFWSSLSSAISEVVFSKHATVKVIAAYWAYYLNGTDEYLKSLLYSNVLCSSSKYNNCAGKVEIKYYEVPGYNKTGPALSNGKSTGNIYPDFTRVNHAKYVVSDVRAHIATSNLIWDYFYTTAGVSFGTDNPSIISQLQEVFDADWNSPYAIPIVPL